MRWQHGGGGSCLGHARRCCSADAHPLLLAGFSWLLIVVCAPVIAVTAGVFIATMAVRGGSGAVEAAASAMPASIMLPTCARRRWLLLVDC